MATQRTTEATFTGRHMLAIMIAFFGVVIAVNLVMATIANSSWTGLVVKNSYVASQEFNRRRAEGLAQAELGWRGELLIDGGRVSYRLSDRDGDPVGPTAVTATFRRPAYDAEDMTLVLAPAGDGRFEAAQTVRDGIWIVEVDAEAGLQKPYRDVRRVVVRGGALQ